MKVGKWFESSRNSIKQSSVRLSFLLVVTCFLVFSASAQVQILKPTASTDAEGSTTSPGNAHDFDYVVNLNTSSTTTQPNADPSITWNSWDTTDKRSYLDLNLTVTVSSSAFSDDTWSIYYDNTTGGCSSASTVIKASGSENIATTNYTVSLPAGQDLSNLDVCIVGSRNKGGDSGNVNIFDIRTEGYYETDPPQWRNQGQDKNVMQSHENNTLFAQASDPGGLNWAMLSTNETGVFQNQSRRTDTAEYNASIGAPECSVVSPEVCVAGSNLLLSKDNIGTPEPNSPNTIDGAVDGTSGTYASDESMENITIEAVDGALIEPGEQVRVTLWVHCFSSDDNINLVYTSDVANPSWIVKDAVGSCSAQGYHRYQFTFNLDNVEGRHAVRGLIQYQGSTSTTAQAGQYDDNDDLVFSVEDKTDAEENSLGSKIFFNGSTAWEWSNFTWSNPGVPLGSLVGWRIWYSDTNGNMNSTDIESFAIAGPASIENLTVYNGSDYSNLENLSAVTRADTAIFRTNVTTTVSGIDSVSIVLRNSTGQVKLSNTSMTNISAVSSGGTGGQYEYNYSIPNDADVGEWSFTVWANSTDGLLSSATENFGVYVPANLNITFNRSTKRVNNDTSFTVRLNITCSGKNADAECGGLTGFMRSANYTFPIPGETGTDIPSDMRVENSPSWWNNNWKYRKEVTITERSGSVLKAHQVIVNITHRPDMRTDFGDVRFVNSTQDSLDYWIRDKSDGQYAEFLVKLSRIPASSNKTVHLYYGNPSAVNQSNISATHTFYDDFESYSTTDPEEKGLWNVTQGADADKAATLGTAAISSGELQLTTYDDGSWVNVLTQKEQPFGVLKMRILANNVGNDYFEAGQGYVNNTITNDGANGFQDERLQIYSNSFTGDQQFEAESTAGNSFPIVYGWAEFHDVTFASFENRCYFEMDGSVQVNTTEGSYCPGINRTIGFVANSYSGTIDPHVRVDWVRLRKTASVKPRITVSNETTARDCGTYMMYGDECSLAWDLRASRLGAYDLQPRIDANVSWINSVFTGRKKICVEKCPHKINFSVQNSTGFFPGANVEYYNATTTVKSGSQNSFPFIKTILPENRRYNVRQSADLYSTFFVSNLIGLNITSEIQRRPQVVKNYSGSIPAGITNVTTVYAFNDTGLDYQKANITVPRFHDSNAILHCTLWNYEARDCGSWETNWLSDYSAQENSTHVKFSVNTFDAYALADQAYLEVNLTSPPSPFSSPQNYTFSLNATVTCRNGDCGEVNATARYNESIVPDTAIPSTGEPFYTVSGPARTTCDSYLVNDESCSVGWIINTTGNISTKWLVDVNFTTNNTAPSNDTSDAEIMIINRIISISLGWSSTSFGAIDPGVTDSPAVNNSDMYYNITVNPETTENVDIWVNATSLQQEDGSYMIGPGNISVSTTNDPGTAQNLTTTLKLLSGSVTPDTNLTTYYWLDIPPVKADNYTGTLWVTANETG